MTQINDTNILSVLETDGIYEGKIDEHIIDFWNSKYYSNIDNWILKKQYNQYFLKINPNDKFIKEIFLSEIQEIVSCLYKKQARIRDIHAVLTLPKKSNVTYTGHASIWHTDLKNSFAVMVLLNKITVNDTHMEFCVGRRASNQSRLLNFNTRGKNIKSCTGDSGTFFLFNNGDYIHRQKLLSEKNRKTIHCIYLPEDDQVFNTK